MYIAGGSYFATLKTEYQQNLKWNKDSDAPLSPPQPHTLKNFSNSVQEGMYYWFPGSSVYPICCNAGLSVSYFVFSEVRTDLNSICISWVLKISPRNDPEQNIINSNKINWQMLAAVNQNKSCLYCQLVLNLCHKVISLLQIPFYNRCSALTCWYLAAYVNLAILLILPCNHMDSTS